MKSDANFLAKCGIIDYSLLLGEIIDDKNELEVKMMSDPDTYKGVYFSADRSYIIGIIDPLTGFK